MLDLRFSDTLIICATIAGPVLAVQAQKVVERATQRRRQKLKIFYVLMSTRAARVSADHVQALNQIDLEFSGARFFNLVQWQTPKERAVVDAWRLYCDKLSQRLTEETEAAIQGWTQTCDDLFMDLLLALSKALGFSFDKVQLRRGIYTPRAHGEAEALQRSIEHHLEKILKGDLAIQMNVVGFPVSKEALELQRDLQTALLRLVSQEQGLPVTIKSPGSERKTALPP